MRFKSRPIIDFNIWLKIQNKLQLSRLRNPWVNSTDLNEAAAENTEGMYFMLFVINDSLMFLFKKVHLLYVEL